MIILEQNDGWWKGDLNGNVGVFPANFVSVIKADESASDGPQDQGDQPKPFKLAAYGVKQGGIGSLFAGGIPPLKKGGTLQRKKSSLPSPPNNPEAALSRSDVPPLPHRRNENECDPNVEMRVIVKFDYHAVNADEINLTKGTHVDVYNTEADRGWFSGRNEDGMVGLFPANFVEEIKNTDAANGIATPKIPQAEPELAPDGEKRTTGSEQTTTDVIISKGSEHPPTLPSRPLESTENESSTPLETTMKAPFGGIKVLPGAIPLMPLGVVNQSTKGNTVETRQQDPVPGIALSSPRKPTKPSPLIPGLHGDNGPLSPQSPMPNDQPISAEGDVSSASTQPKVPARPSGENSVNLASPVRGIDSELQDSMKAGLQDLQKRLSFVPPKPPISRKPQLQGHEAAAGRDNTREIGESSHSEAGGALSMPNTSRPGTPVRPATPEKHHRYASKNPSAPNSPTKPQSASTLAQAPKVPKRDNVEAPIGDPPQQSVGSEAADFSDTSKEDIDVSDVQSGNESMSEGPAESKGAGAPKLSHLTKARVSRPKSRRHAESGSAKDKGLGVIEQMIEDVNNAPSPVKDGTLDSVEPSESKAKVLYKQPTPFVLAGGIPPALKHVTISKPSMDSDTGITQAPFSPPSPSPASMSSPRSESQRPILRTEKSFSMDSPHKGSDDSEVVTRHVFEQLRKELEHKLADERAARRKLEAEVRDLRLLMQDEFKKLRRTLPG